MNQSTSLTENIKMPSFELLLTQTNSCSLIFFDVCLISAAHFPEALCLTPTNFGNSQAYNTASAIY